MATVTTAQLSGRYLSFVEREEVAILHAATCGVREIAHQLGRSPATISRELRRNAATRCGGLEYRATAAQWHADRRARRPKVAKLVANDALRGYVQDRLGGLIRSPTGIVVPGPTVRWMTRVELASAIFEYLEIFHNRQRRHSSLGMLTPVEFEARHQPTTAA